MRELDAYKKKAPTKDKNVVPFVERLFAWAEKHGPKVEVRFQRKKSESIGPRRINTSRRRRRSWARSPIPSRYFDEKHGTKRERRPREAARDDASTPA